MTTHATLEVRVPDIGDFKDIPVIEILVQPGDVVSKDQGLMVLESDKATMEIPSPTAGKVKELRVKLGDSVREGSVIALLETSEAGAAKIAPAQEAVAQPAAAPVVASPPPSTAQPSIAQAEVPPAAAKTASSAPLPGLPIHPENFKQAHASPSVRKFARELGVDLSQVVGSGPKSRILAEDVQAYVKAALARLNAGPSVVGVSNGEGLDLLPWPKVDFAKFGAVEAQPLSRIKKISGANLHRNWVRIPHVTNHEDADITELEAFRVQMNQEQEKSGAASGAKLTMLAFLIKAAVAALRKFPEFNASLDGEQIIYKKYFHIGFAADTPNGLMVPVIKDADQKGILAIAQETAELAKKAREGKLTPTEMQGGCFSISSLGGIGGTYFTPIINAPEVAILGVCKAAMKPVWDGSAFVPRLILPLSLSWDHRVIDGASAARFNGYLTQLLADFRRISL